MDSPSATPTIGTPLRQWVKGKFSLATAYREARDGKLTISYVRGRAFITPEAEAAYRASLATYTYQPHDNSKAA